MEVTRSGPADLEVGFAAGFDREPRSLLLLGNVARKGNVSPGMRRNQSWLQSPSAVASLARPMEARQGLPEIQATGHPHKR